MVPAVSDRIPRVPPYSGNSPRTSAYLYAAFMLFGLLFQNSSSLRSYLFDCPYYPDTAVTASVWALSLSLAATQEIDVSFFSSSYLDVSVQRVCPPFGVTGLLPVGLPHSDICGSILVCKSPQLFAAYHVLRRLQEPRHPPYALILLYLYLFH